MRVAGLILLALVAAACSDGGSSGPTPDTDLPWSDYAPGLQARIDTLGTSRDCAGLQDEFDTAAANNDATRNRTGHDNVELIGYIDDTMEMASCYE